jgi:hypothetical protein
MVKGIKNVFNDDVIKSHICLHITIFTSKQAERALKLEAHKCVCLCILYMYIFSSSDFIS